MKPILFNTEMVQAILEGRKTVTRRVVKLKNGYSLEGKGKEITENINLFGDDIIFRNGEETNETLKPQYKVEDILYVRETWQRNYCNDVIVTGKYAYRASPETWQYFSEEEKNLKKKWKPSIHMPKVAARIFLKVTDVRVEKLQDITEMQVRKEGFRDYLAADDIFYPCGYYFRQTWDSTINKQDLDKYGWEANPWVWVIEFERVEVGNE